MTFNMKKYYANVSNEIEKLKENNLKLITNAVLGIKIDLETTQTGKTTVSIIGTAVKVA